MQEVTTRAPFIGEAVMLLAQLYERTLAHEKGIAFLRRCRETVVPASAGIHAHIARFLGDFLAKTNRVEAAKAEYERAMNFSANFSSDQSVLSKARISNFKYSQNIENIKNITENR
jgi:hypothetical protein